jgi:hypothetical protein
MQSRLKRLFCVAMFPLAGALACGSRDVDVIDGGVSDGGVSDGGACGCVAQAVEWGMTGGFVVYNDMSTLDPCSTFGHRRVSRSPDPPSPTCEQALGDCSGAIGASDVSGAIANADVQAAIAAAPVFYGVDTRPVDGQALSMQIGGAIVEVGEPCGLAPCKAIPPGIGALANLLQALTKQELARPPCNTSFPPP